MSERVVVLGAGYAGCVAIQTLEREFADAELTWVSEFDYHLVLHEVHRVISDPSVREQITIPVESIKSNSTEFIEDRIVGIDAEARRVDLASMGSVEYDYLLVALGSDTAFYGIPGIAERAYTLTGLDDALAIHDAVAGADSASGSDPPARVFVGGAGLSGIQSVGELTRLRDRHGLSIEITLVEALDEVLPEADPALQRRIRRTLHARGVEVLTDHPITNVAPNEIHFDEHSPSAYDVLIWTGGITGRRSIGDPNIEDDHRRLLSDVTFRTSDERVFAVGDAAVVDLDGEPAPPTAQVAWDAASVAATNVARTVEGRPLRRWTYRDKGTLISIGEQAIAHDVLYLPVETFGGPPAVFLKKLVAARWIATITSWSRGLNAWNVL